MSDVLSTLITMTPEFFLKPLDKNALDYLSVDSSYFDNLTVPNSLISEYPVNESLIVNGVPIIEIENIMKRGRTPYLHQHEALTTVLNNDNQFITSQGLTHKDLAMPLLLAESLALEKKSKAFRLNNHQYAFSAIHSFGIQQSPFQDGLDTDTDIIIWNLDTDLSIRFSLINPHYIAKYGFYEGTQSTYRLDPQKLITFFNIQPQNY